MTILCEKGSIIKLIKRTLTIQADHVKTLSHTVKSEYNRSHLNSSDGCLGLSPEQDFSPQVVPNSIKVLLIEQNFTDRPVKGAVGQV